MAVFLNAIKNTANFKWKQVENGYETLLSVCLNGRNMGLEKGFLITYAYIPPCHSRYGKPEHFDELDDFLLSIMSGDFNAHTGTVSDIVPVNEDNEYNLPKEDIFAILRTAGFSKNRCNQDPPLIEVLMVRSWLKFVRIIMQLFSMGE